MANLAVNNNQVRLIISLVDGFGDVEPVADCLGVTKAEATKLMDDLVSKARAVEDITWAGE